MSAENWMQVSMAGKEWRAWDSWEGNRPKVLNRFNECGGGEIVQTQCWQRSCWKVVPRRAECGSGPWDGVGGADKVGLLVEQEQAVPTSHRQTRNRKQAGNARSRGQKAGGFTRAETWGEGWRQVGSIPGKQSGNKYWRVRHESKDNLANELQLRVQVYRVGWWGGCGWLAGVEQGCGEWKFTSSRRLTEQICDRGRWPNRYMPSTTITPSTVCLCPPCRRWWRPPGRPSAMGGWDMAKRAGNIQWLWNCTRACLRRKINCLMLKLLIRKEGKLYRRNGE